MDKSGGIDYQEFVSMMVPNSVATIKKLSANFKSVTDIKAAFKRFDADGDGQITRNEMKNGMRCSDAELDIIYALGDLDGDGEISVGEFIRVMSPSTAAALQRFRNTFACIEDVCSAFRVIDSNNDGALNKKELAEGMNSFGKEFVASEIESVFSLADVNSDGEICSIFAMGDTDQDGKISFLEFSKIMIPSCQDTLTKFWKCFRNVQGVRETFKKFDADGDAQIS